MADGFDGYPRGQRTVRWLASLDAHPMRFRLAAAFTLAIATGLLAQVKLYTPLTPVPFTLQTFGVLLMGGLLGRRWGTLSAVLYLIMGLVGLPVFAGQVEDAGGFGAALSTMTAFGGLRVFETALSAGFLLGFPLVAYAMGWARDRADGPRTGFLVGFAPAALLVLTCAVVLDAVAVADTASTTYYNGPTQAVFFGLLVLFLAAVAGGAAWLAFTRRARRERVELFLAGFLGLGAMHVIGATWFYFAAPSLGLPHVTVWTTLRFTLFPFLALDVVKLLGAVGLLTLVRPRTTNQGAPTHV